MSAGAGNIHLSRNQPELAPGPSCSGTIECALAGLADQVILALWLLLLVVVAVASLVFLPRARRLCQREIRRAQSELDAFDAFITQLKTVPTTTLQPTDTAANSAPLIQHRTDGGTRSLTQVHDIYRETVMAVPHFEEDYGESILDHMSAELSSELAFATANGAEFGPHLKENLLEAAVEARDRRAEYIATLNEEAGSLERYEETLADLEPAVEQRTSPLCSTQTFSELQYRHEALEDQADVLESVTQERQSDRRSGRTGAIHLGNQIDLQEYLYKPMDVNYPVLAEASSLLARVKITTKRVEDELIYRG